jgi:hypothetical protein
MKDYMINGTCVKKNGTRYPFRKRLDALDREDAKEQIKQILAAKQEKLYNNGKGLRITAAEAKPLKERPSKRKVQRKECRVCAPTRGPLPLGAFGKDKNSKDGLMATCRECRSKQQKASRERLQKPLRLHSQLGLKASELPKVKTVHIGRIKINDETYIREKDITKVLSEMSFKFCKDLMNRVRS